MKLKTKLSKLRHDGHITDAEYAIIINVLNKFSTQPPKPKVGKWIEYCYQNRICSNCYYIAADTDIDEYKYCPNCGAKMEVEE